LIWHARAFALALDKPQFPAWRGRSQLLAVRRVFLFRIQYQRL